jgi:hypothetical protein
MIASTGTIASTMEMHKSRTSCRKKGHVIRSILTSVVIRIGDIMPQVRKLDDAEVRTIERKQFGQRKVTEIEYDRYLADFASGDYGEVTLNGDDKRLTVRSRLKAAASRHQPPLSLTFKPTRGNTLRFYVAEFSTAPAPAHVVDEPSAPRTPPAVIAAPTTTSPSPTKKRGGTAGNKNTAATPTPPSTSTRRRREKAGT